jgi:hypothetical protein
MASPNLIVDYPPILRVSSGQHHPLVIGRLLLLCILHCTDLYIECCDNPD